MAKSKGPHKIILEARLAAFVESRMKELGFTSIEDYMWALLARDVEASNSDPDPRATHAKMRALMEGGMISSLN